MTLRTRLAWTYGLAVAVAVTIVAIVSFSAIDRTLRTALDGRLATTAAALAALVDVDDGTLHFDREDREQMASALETVMDGAIFTPSGGVFVTSNARIPAPVRTLAAARRFWLKPQTFRVASAVLRSVCRPVSRGAAAYAYACVWENAAYIDDVDRDLLVAIALAALLGGGVVVVLSSTLARRALAPLEAFTDLATEIEAQDLSRRVGRAGPDELGRLGSAFDRMLDRLESAFARQRRFTADASHELRAPLAVIRAEAEAALARERAPGEYQSSLATIVAEVERIDALVDALLLAARADSARLHFAPVDVRALAALVAERFAAPAAARGVSIRVEGAAPLVDADGASLERAIAAIVHNAIDYASTEVVIDVAEPGSGVSVCVRDDGPGFSADGLLHAKERFWRADRRGRPGTGLGLAIAESIARAHGGTLELSNGARGAVVALVVSRSS